MNIIVVGSGKIGTAIIESLIAEGHEVTVIDNNHSVLESAVNQYDCMGVCGSGTDCNVLMESGAENCDLFIAVTGSDEFNMLSCFMAKGLGADHTIARIRNPEYNDNNLDFIREQLGLSMAINPEALSASAAFNLMKFPSAAKIETFSKRSFEMIELRLSESDGLDGVALMDLKKKYRANFLICAVRRGKEVYIPDGTFTLKTGDRIGIMAVHTEIEKLLRQMGLMKRQAKNAMIVGASRTAHYLSKMLIRSGTAVKVIDNDPKKCAAFCENVPEAVVIQGDAAQQAVLLEEGLQSTDALATLTGIDEVNILIALFAANLKVRKVISRINRNEFSDMAESIGIDSIISPRQVIADVLVRYARGLANSMGAKMETLYKIMDSDAEALEFLIPEDCSLIGEPLKDLKLKKNVLIAGIKRGEKAIIPSGSDSIEAGDSVIILAAGRRINDISDIIG